MHKKINDIKLDGFAVNSAAPGEMVKVQVKDWATSEAPHFYIYAEQIANIIFPKLEIANFRNKVNNYLAVIHPDNTADIYTQDNLKIVAKIKANRSVKAGEFVYAKDIDDIEEIRFPDIPINSDDKVIFLERSGWRFGIFFDFTKKINKDILAVDIARLQKNLVLEDILKNTLAEIRSKESQAELVSKGKPEEIYEAFIITEGKTDWMHLEKAFKEISYNRMLEYSKPEKELGDSGLLQICHLAIHGPLHKVPLICIFDRDNQKIIKELLVQSEDEKSEYQSWGNNVFSIMLPIPKDRESYKNISIEMYYSDEVIKHTTADGKRLFFDNELVMKRPVSGGVTEFNPTAPLHEFEFTKKVYSGLVENIEDSSGRKVGLSKTAFAELIYNKQEPFKGINFENFRGISSIIEKIITTHISQRL